mmetsp:Transcript_3017/g.6827  ORF Transcript_3017/g.6827 Transcript_3017/m.6827 type:complete len:260 (+) Transcript_3017:804-1583(+)
MVHALDAPLDARCTRWTRVVRRLRHGETAHGRLVCLLLVHVASHATCHQPRTLRRTWPIDASLVRNPRVRISVQLQHVRSAERLPVALARAVRIVCASRSGVRAHRGKHVRHVARNAVRHECAIRDSHRVDASGVDRLSNLVHVLDRFRHDVLDERHIALRLGHVEREHEPASICSIPRSADGQHDATSVRRSAGKCECKLLGVDELFESRHRFNLSLRVEAESVHEHNKREFRLGAFVLDNLRGWYNQRQNSFIIVTC